VAKDISAGEVRFKVLGVAAQIVMQCSLYLSGLLKVPGEHVEIVGNNRDLFSESRQCTSEKNRCLQKAKAFLK
jgi:hypothetical protein